MRGPGRGSFVCLSDERALQNRLSERYEGKLSDMLTLLEFSGMLFAMARVSYPRIFGATQESNLQRREKIGARANRPTPSLFLSFLMSASSACRPAFYGAAKTISRRRKNPRTHKRVRMFHKNCWYKKYDFWRKLLWLKKRN